MPRDGLDRLANLLGQVSLRLTTDVGDAVAETAGVRLAHAEALLALLAHANGERPEVLASALGFSQSGSVHVVDRLVEQGWVKRTPDRDDGRAVRLQLTPKGRRRAHRLRQARQDVITDALAALDETQKSGLLSALEVLAPRDVESEPEARRVCRWCDPEACGHPDACPVTTHLDAVLDRA
jgi:DNA-binding MarR family transcriptional regulator